MSLRLEKGWGVWTLEFRPDFNAVESGMDAFINWNKDFVGKAATLQFKEQGVERKLVTLVIDTEVDVTQDEAVLYNGEAVGYITSGGYAHHVQKCMALAYVRADLVEGGNQFDVEILGEMKSAQLQLTPIYDPAGEKMRS